MAVAPHPGLVRLIEAAGSQSALGRIIKRRQSSISSRLLRGKPLWAEDVSAAEAGTGVPRHIIRPDLFGNDNAPSSDDSLATSAPIVACDRSGVLHAGARP